MSYPPQQGYGAPGGYPPPGGYGGPTAKQTNGLAIGALVCGIASIVTCLFPLGLVAAILGFVALKKAREMNGSGRGLAIGGIVTGLLALIVGTALVLIIVVFADDVADDPSILCGSDERSADGHPCENQGDSDPNGGDDGIDSDPADEVCNVDRFIQDPDC